MQDKHLKFSDFDAMPYETIRDRAKSERTAAIRDAFRAIFGSRHSSKNDFEF